jgi:hypothetical protein
MYRQLEPHRSSYLPDTEGARPEGRKLSPDDIRALARANSSATEATFTVLRPL